MLARHWRHPLRSDEGTLLSAAESGAVQMHQCDVDTEPRAAESASDHTIVWAEFRL